MNSEKEESAEVELTTFNPLPCMPLIIYFKLFIPPGYKDSKFIMKKVKCIRHDKFQFSIFCCTIVE
jgi:hypothetical protein